MTDINVTLKRMKKADYKNGCLTDRDRQIKEDEIFQARLSLIGGAEYGV